MKRRWIAGLCLALMLLSGCAGSPQETVPPVTDDNAAFVGTWQTELNLTELLNERLQAEEKLAEYLELADFRLAVSLTFREDGTYAIALEGSSWDAAIEAMMTQLTDAVSRYLEDLVLEETGKELDIGAILEAAGTTMDAFVERFFPQQRIQELKTEAAKAIQAEGKFLAREGKLCLASASAAEFDQSTYDVYTLAGDTLTLTERVGAAASPMKDFYPLVFQRTA